MRVVSHKNWSGSNTTAKLLFYGLKPHSELPIYGFRSGSTLRGQL